MLMKSASCYRLVNVNLTFQSTSPIFSLRAGLKDRMNLCLFCLSLVDGMFVFFFSLSSSSCLVQLFRPDLQTWWKWVMISYFAGISKGSLLCSGCLTMIISVERCVCVFLPLRATTLIRTRTMAVIVFTTIAAIHTICLMFPLKVQCVCVSLLCCFQLVSGLIRFQLDLSASRVVPVGVVLALII